MGTEGHQELSQPRKSTIVIANQQQFMANRNESNDSIRGKKQVSVRANDGT